MREEIERDTLRLLCSELIQPATRLRLIGILQEAVFADPLHRVMYEEIAAIGEMPAKRLRELLPGRVTLRGFPDFDLKEVLERDGSRDEDIDHWFESLLELSEAQQEAKTEGKKKAMGQSA